MRFLFRPAIRRYFLGLWCVAWIGVCLLLLMPIRLRGFAGADLLAHTVLFGAMALTTVTFCRRPFGLSLFALLTVAAGALLEWAQTLVSYRSFDPLDAIANTVGAGLGYAVAMCVLVFLIRPALADASGDEAQDDVSLFNMGPSGAPPKM